MPQSKEVHREYMKARREGSQVKVHNSGFTKQGSQLLSRPNMMIDGKVVFQDNEYDPTERIWGNPYYKDGTLRYLGPMSDGQVLDRLTV